MSRKQWFGMRREAHGSMYYRLSGAFGVMCGAALIVIAPVFFGLDTASLAVIGIGLCFVIAGTIDVCNLPKSMNDEQVRWLFRRFNRCPSCGYQLAEPEHDATGNSHPAIEEGHGARVIIHGVRCSECGGVW